MYMLSLRLSEENKNNMRITINKKQSKILHKFIIIYYFYFIYLYMEQSGILDQLKTIYMRPQHFKYMVSDYTGK